MVTLLTKPFRQAGKLDRKSAQEPGRHSLAGLSPSKKIDHPGRTAALRWIVARSGEGIDERGLLGAGRGCGIEPSIEFGEDPQSGVSATLASDSSSSP